MPQNVTGHTTMFAQGVMLMKGFTFGLALAAALAVCSSEAQAFGKRGGKGGCGGVSHGGCGSVGHVSHGGCGSHHGGFALASYSAPVSGCSSCGSASYATAGFSSGQFNTVAPSIEGWSSPISGYSSQPMISGYPQQAIYYQPQIQQSPMYASNYGPLQPGMRIWTGSGWGTITSVGPSQPIMAGSPSINSGQQPRIEKMPQPENRDTRPKAPKNDD